MNIDRYVNTQLIVNKPFSIRAGT